MRLTKPLFIALDGIDGCGKSTQVKILADFFKKSGSKIFITKEPGGTDVGIILRDILISKKYHIDHITELLLYAADRNEHQKDVVIPMLEKGVSVITDRFLSSTYAYQIFGRKLNKDILDTLSQITVTKYPDFTFILDIDPKTAISRARSRLKNSGTFEDEGKFESLGISFYENVREGFIWYANTFKNCHIIDANKPIKSVHKEILDILSL